MSNNSSGVWFSWKFITDTRFRPILNPLVRSSGFANFSKFGDGTWNCSVLSWVSATPAIDLVAQNDWIGRSVVQNFDILLQRRITEGNVSGKSRKSNFGPHLLYNCEFTEFGDFRAGFCLCKSPLKENIKILYYRSPKPAVLSYQIDLWGCGHSR